MCHFMYVFTWTYYWYHLQIHFDGIWSCEGEITHLSFPQDSQPIHALVLVWVGTPREYQRYCQKMPTRLLAVFARQDYFVMLFDGLHNVILQVIFLKVVWTQSALVRTNRIVTFILCTTTNKRASMSMHEIVYLFNVLSVLLDLWLYGAYSP